MKASDAKKKLIDQSVHLIAEQGLEGLSFREMARRAGVSHQTPYYHFTNREGILTAIALEGFLLLDAGLVRARANAGKRSSQEILRDVLRAYITCALEHPVHFRVMFRPELARRRRNSELHGQAMQTFRHLVDSVSDCHPRAVANDRSLVAIADALWAGAHGIATLWLDGPMKAISPQITLTALINSTSEFFAEAGANTKRLGAHQRTMGAGKAVPPRRHMLPKDRSKLS